MAIARRVDGSSLHTTSTASLSVTLGATPVDGDLLVAFVESLTTTIPSGVPAGWTLLGSQPGGVNSGTWVWTKTAASETGTYAWTGVGSVKAAAWVGCYSGADTSAAPAFLTGQITTGTTSVTTPSGLTVPNTAWSIVAVGARHPAPQSAASSWTDSDGADSARLNGGSNAGSGTDISVCLFDSGRALAPGFLSRTLSSTNTEGQVACWAIVLPATGAPAVSYVPGGWGVGT